MMDLLSPKEVLERGFSYVNVRWKDRKLENNQVTFHANYGTSAGDLAEMGYDLCHTNIPEALLEQKEVSTSGFKAFLRAHFFLWTYPKNSELFAAHFGVSEKYCRGKYIWKWVRRIAAMKHNKIALDASIQSPNTEKFALTTDGVDFGAWEVKHATEPKDTGFFTYKHGRCGFKYLISLSVFHSKCAFLDGPFRGGENDLNMFRNELKAKIPEGKLVIVDRGFESGQDPTEKEILATPNPCDSKALAKFKSRARCRHETFNGRIKKFASMSQTFCHGMNKHKHAFVAVCVIIQYQLDNGGTLFAV